MASAAETAEGNLVAQRITPDVLQEKNIFIACESDEDLPYLISRLGEGTLVTGTDYSHNDAGTQITVYSEMDQRVDVERRAIQKIVDVNGRRLFSIPEDFCPSDAVARGAVHHVKPYVTTTTNASSE